MNYLDIGEVAGELEMLDVFRNCPTALLQQGGARAFDVVGGDRFGCVDENGAPVLICVLAGAITVPSPDLKRGVGASRLEDNVQHLPGSFLGITEFLAARPSDLIVTAIKPSILLAINVGLFFRIIDEVDGFSSNFLNSPSIRRSMVMEGEKQKFLREHIYTTPLNDIDGLMNRDWLENRLPSILSDCALKDIAVTVLAINTEILFTPDEEVYVKMIAEVSKVLHTALRPTDISVHYSNNLILTFLINTTDQASLIVSTRLKDRIGRLVIYADMRRQLPHVGCNIASKSVVGVHEVRDFISTNAS